MASPCNSISSRRAAASPLPINWVIRPSVWAKSIDRDGEQWYHACCKITLDKPENWGVLPNGVVSSSGLGDGSYDVYGIKNAEGEYVAFRVVFIDLDEEDELDEWDENNEN